MYKYILTFLLLIGCSDFLNTWDAYEIQKGQHYSTRTGMPRRLVSLKEGRHLRFDAYFTNSCLYDTAGMGNDAFDINKLYGFTDANSFNGDNSIRIGWRHNSEGKIEVFAYWHRDGKIGWEKLGETSPYAKDQYELWARNGFYYFRFNTVEFSTPRSVDAEQGIRTRMYPYFGGNLPAPNDMQIFIYEYS